MKPLHNFTRKVGRVAVHIGVILALASAVVIVANAPALAPAIKAKPAADVIRLEPVTVTISSQRFDAIRAEINGPLRLVRETSRKPDEV